MAYDPFRPIPEELCSKCRESWRAWRWFKAPASWLQDSSRHGRTLREHELAAIESQHEVILKVCTERHRRPRGFHAEPGPRVDAPRENGVDICWCGCKYWVDGRCFDCGSTEAVGP